MAKHRNTGSIFQRGKTWYVRFRKRVTKPDGTPRWKSVYLRVGEDKGLAIEKLNQVRAALDRERVLGVRAIGAITLREFWKRTAMPILRARLTERGFDIEERRVNRMAEFLGDDLLRDVDAVRVEELRAHLSNEHGCGGATVNRYCATLSVVFKLAIQKRFATENPVRGIKRRKEEEKPVPFLASEDLDRIYARCPATVRPVAIIAAETGLRRGELVSLEWQDVSFDRRTLVVRRSKSKRSRIIPLSPRAEATLRAQLEERGAIPMNAADRVFAAILAHGSTERYAVEWLSKTFASAAKRAGFPDLGLHGLRHAFCSALSQAGIPLTTIQQLAGHSTISVTARYARHAPEGADRAAIDRLALTRGQTREGWSVGESETAYTPATSDRPLRIWGARGSVHGARSPDRAAFGLRSEPQGTSESVQRYGA